MENQPLFSGVHDLSAEESSVFFNQLLLVCKSLKSFYGFIIHGHGAVVVDKSSCFLDGCTFDALCIEVSLDVERFDCLELREAGGFIKIFIIDHVVLRIRMRFRLKYRTKRTCKQ